MKVVYNSRTRDADISYLVEHLPEYDFTLTYGPDDVAREIGSADVFIVSNRVYLPDMAAAVKDNAQNLKLIHFTTSGIDKALKSGGFPEGVPVCNVAGLRAPTLAEHAFAMLLFLSHNFRGSEAAQKAHEWPRDELTGSVVQLKGKTLCVIGMGATGQNMARKAHAFDMRVIGVSRGYEADEVVEEVYPREDVKTALGQADAVLLSMPSTPETRGFMDADKFAAMKPSAFLLNIARGDLVNEDDLVAACRAGAIGGAGLDVTREEPTPAASPLWDEPRIVLTPHVGGGGSSGIDYDLYDMLIENLRLLKAGHPLVRTVAWETMTA